MLNAPSPPEKSITLTATEPCEFAPNDLGGEAAPGPRGAHGRDPFLRDTARVARDGREECRAGTRRLRPGHVFPDSSHGRLGEIARWRRDGWLRGRAGACRRLRQGERRTLLRAGERPFPRQGHAGSADAAEPLRADADADLRHPGAATLLADARRAAQPHIH